MPLIASPSASIYKILGAIRLPPHQWNVVGVEVTIDARGPSLVRIARVNGTSEVWEDCELLDGDGKPFAPGWKLEKLVDTILGRRQPLAQRVTLSARIGETPKLTVQSVATEEDVRLWSGGLELLTTAVPVVDLVPADVPA